MLYNKLYNECSNRDSQCEVGKLLHLEISDVIHGSFKNTGEIWNLTERCLTFFIRNEDLKAVSAAYGYPFAVNEVIIVYIATLGTERHKGYASSLISGLIHSDKLRFIRITVNVEETSPVTGFYERLGFKYMTDTSDREKRKLYDFEKKTLMFQGHSMTTVKPRRCAASSNVG